MALGLEVANAKVVALDCTIASGIQWNKPNPFPSSYGLRVAGWGVINAFNSRPQQLQSADVGFVDDRLCASYTKDKFKL